MSAFETIPSARMSTPGIVDFLQPPSVAMRHQNPAGKSFHEVFRNTVFETQASVAVPEPMQQRLEQMGIRLSERDMQRLNEGVEKARTTGAPQAIVMVDRNSFVMDVTSNTLVDVMHNGPNTPVPNRDGVWATKEMAFIASV